MERLDEIMIVAAGPGDSAALARVHVRAWRETYVGLLPAAYLAQMNPATHARRWRRLLMASPSPEIVLAAEGRDGLVGYCAGHPRADGAMVEVSTLYLLRGVQKCGLGRRLLSAMARVFRDRGATSLILWVLNGNSAARGFYEHLGGLPVAERTVQGWGGGLRETAYSWSDIDRLVAAGD